MMMPGSGNNDAETPRRQASRHQRSEPLSRRRALIAWAKAHATDLLFKKSNAPKSAGKENRQPQRFSAPRGTGE